MADSDKKTNNELSLLKLISLLSELGKGSFWGQRLVLRELLDLVESRFIPMTPTLRPSLDLDQLNQLPCSEEFKQIFEYLSFCRTHQIKSEMAPSSREFSIVLVSGVFNEFFTTAAFERAAKYIKAKYGIDYYVPRVGGASSTKENVERLSLQLSEFVTLTNKPLWIVAYSKGGIDTLHYLIKNKSFASKHIKGVSLIASPILGSPHIDQRFLTLLRKVPTLSSSFLLTHLDLLARKFQLSLSKKHQSNWFRSNYKDLPSSLFYTSSSFVVPWKEVKIPALLLKTVFDLKKEQDALVFEEDAHFPRYFKASQNLGQTKGHHWVSSKSSCFDQESYLEALYLFLDRHQKL